MIRYLLDNEKGKSEALYRAAFPEDKDAFVEYYYSYVTRDNKILVLEQEGEISSMQHLNPRPSSVVAFTLTLLTGTFSAFAIFSRICGMCGAIFGL